MNVVFQAGPNDEVRGAYTYQPWSRDEDAPTVIGVATNDRIHFLGEDGQARFEIPYHFDRARYPNIRLGILKDQSRAFVWYTPSNRVGGQYARNTPSYIVEVSSDGTELARHTLPSLYVPSVIPWYDGLLGALLPFVVAIGAVVVGYFVGRPGGFGNPLGEAAWWDPMINEEAAAFWVGSASVVLAAVICAIIASRIAKRYAFTGRQRRGWTLAGLLLGPLGLLLLLALREWPARRECPACQRLRVVDRGSCEHCGAAWDRPTADGTEVFG
ncbi:MAG: hypothetical protein IID40_08885 [Planctomycetes bacterium]|nr:hypothetical protein [Planctomycetota bacterium]